MTNTLYTPIEISQWWLRRDFSLIPVQPNSKRNVRGFGIHQDKIQSAERFAVWFDDNSNLAVCASHPKRILDFDDADRYAWWAKKFPNESQSYTERTPNNGYHVFAEFYGESLDGIALVPGVELLQVVLVSPSVVNGKQYARGMGDILRMDSSVVFSHLAKPRRSIPPQRSIIRQGAGKLDQIKSSFSCLDVIQAVNPKIKVRISSRRFLSLPCPFHDDKEPSFWILPERNLWGCHACGIRGDVINLFARLHGLSNSDAIREMGKVL
ncbi:MAG: hypothetical protein DCC56_09540 [Anaerolineae bacterium]|nr:MAG: hypothetical protein DCC56_09540 [Anaerolineae bacterium]WKZ45169.1 MAG: CHC2 zinc finger domain-containing protein [Anaerolineales bacterium]